MGRRAEACPAEACGPSWPGGRGSLGRCAIAATDRDDRLAGCLLGLAVGDALGLPYEGLSPRRAARLLGAPDRFRFVFGRGMVSDDTEHAVMTLAAWRAAGGDVETFARDLAARLRWWLLGLPAGLGSATLRSILRLGLGVPPTHSGVRSAGNGPCMRAPVLGLLAASDDDLAALVAASTRLTHTDPRAAQAALAVALAARLAAAGHGPEGFCERFARLCPDIDAELAANLRLAFDPAVGTEDLVARLGLERGVGGFVVHGVPVCLHLWRLHGADYQAAVTAAIRLGGDADTHAAVVGALVASGSGEGCIPRPWLAGVADWPCSVRRLRRLAADAGAIRFGPRHWPRNLFFLAVVLSHGLRRLLPPY